jgi:HNH endonuclease
LGDSPKTALVKEKANQGSCIAVRHGKCLFVHLYERCFSKIAKVDKTPKNMGGAELSLSLKESLAKMGRLSPNKLDQTSRRVRGELAGAEWKMAICLLATVRNGSFRELGYATITEYGEKALNLSGKKVGWLLGAARALEHLPNLSRAFRSGQIGWGKVRAIQSLVTPETEMQWLEFAMAHSTAEVNNKVALSPSAWKRHQALEASLEEKPIVCPTEVDAVLNSEVSENKVSIPGSAPNEEGFESSAPVLACKESGAAAATGRVSAVDGARCQDQTPPRPIPEPPKLIRLVVEMTPDQYALYEQAECRLRARAGKRLSRAKIVSRMAELVLESGTARSRAKHQVLIHTEQQYGRAWYDTERGPLPVSPRVLEEALESVDPIKLESVSGQRSEQIRDSGNDENCQANPLGDLGAAAPQVWNRRHIPNATVRALFARAGNRCERCGTKGRLDVHHTTPVSEGGGNSLKALRLFCSACHSLEHREDFSSKPVWRRAKQAAMSARQGSAGSPYPLGDEAPGSPLHKGRPNPRVLVHNHAAQRDT